MTQGYPLSPTIFKAVVDTLVRNWVSMVAGDAGGHDSLVGEVIYRFSFFYMEDCLVASTEPEWLQGTFDTLTGLFKRVGLHTNASEIVGMIF